MISRRRFQQMDVLEGQNILVTISGKKDKIRVYYLSWLKNKIIKMEGVSVWLRELVEEIRYLIQGAGMQRRVYSPERMVGSSI